MVREIFREPTHTPAEFSQREVSQPFAYDARLKLIELTDRAMEATPLAKTRFRIDFPTLKNLERLVGGPEYKLMEQRIVEGRWRFLGKILELGGVAKFTLSFAVGAAPSESDLLLPLGVSLAGKALGVEESRKTYIEVYQATVPVIEKLLAQHYPDFYRWTPEKRMTFTSEISEAIARGESLDQIHLSEISYGLLNIIALMVSGQDPWTYGSLAVAEGAGILYANRELSEAKEHKEKQHEFKDRQVTIANAMTTFRSRFAKYLHSYQGITDLTKVWTDDATRRILIKMFIGLSIPYAVATRTLESLMAKIFGEVGDHVLGVEEQRERYADAQVGLKQLKEALELIEKNSTSLFPLNTLQGHSEIFQGEANYANESEIRSRFAQDESMVAHIAPFDVRFPHRENPILTMQEAMTFKDGIYCTNSQSGQGESAFFNALAHRSGLSYKKDHETDGTHHTTEQGESYIRLNGEVKRLHDLPAYNLRRVYQYTGPEPQYSDMTPEAIFFDDIKWIIPLEVPDANASAILRKFHYDREMTVYEYNALLLCTEVLTGLRTADEVFHAKVPWKVKRYIEIMLPYFDPKIYGRKQILESLRKYHVDFKGNDESLVSTHNMEEIEKTESFSSLLRSTRAKLRILKTVEKAERDKSKIVVFDQTLDPLNDDDTKIYLQFLTNWSHEKKISIVILTTEDKNKRFIRQTPGAFRGEFSYPGGVATLTEAKT